MANLIETLTALHEEVRQFVEKQSPNYKVTRIESDGRSDYQETRQSAIDRFADPFNVLPEYIMTYGELSFRVTAHHNVIGDSYIIEFRVEVLPDGKLYLQERTLVQTIPYIGPPTNKKERP